MVCWGGEVQNVSGVVGWECEPVQGVVVYLICVFKMLRVCSHGLSGLDG